MEPLIIRKKSTADSGRVRKPSLVLSKSNLIDIKARKQSANLLQLQQLQHLHLQPQQPLLSIQQEQVFKITRSVLRIDQFTLTYHFKTGGSLDKFNELSSDC